MVCSTWHKAGETRGLQTKLILSVVKLLLFSSQRNIQPTSSVSIYTSTTNTQKLTCTPGLLVLNKLQRNTKSSET